MSGTESAEEEMDVGSNRGYESDVLEAVNGNKTDSMMTRNIQIKKIKPAHEVG